MRIKSILTIYNIENDMMSTKREEVKNKKHTYSL